MLSRAIDPDERFFVEEHRKVMLFGDLAHQVHE